MALLEFLPVLPVKRKDAEFKTSVLSVLEILLQNPAMKSWEIYQRLHIDKDSLLKIYSYIQNNKVLWKLLMKNGKYPMFMQAAYLEMVAARDRVEKIMKGETIFPLIIEIHPGEICNSNCAMCYSMDVDYIEKEINDKHRDIDKIVSELIEKRDIAGSSEEKEMDDQLVGLKEQKEGLHPFVHLMSENDIEQLLQEAKEGGVQEIWFSGEKEPLWLKATSYGVKRANELGFATRLYTNGELLDRREGLMETLLYSYQVRFSVNAVTAETYDKIHFAEEGKSTLRMHHRRGKGVFDKVKENIKALVDLRNEKMNDPSVHVSKKPKVKIAISQIIQPFNAHELLAFVLLAKELGVDSVQIRAEAAGKVPPFTEDQKEKITSAVYEIKRRQSLGELDDIELDLRGLSKRRT